MSFKIGNRIYPDPETRLGKHDVVQMYTRSESYEYRRCTLCKYASRFKFGKLCGECLLTDELDSFEIDPLIEGWFLDWILQNDTDIPRRRVNET